jgi:hypothetical protein
VSWTLAIPGLALCFLWLQAANLCSTWLYLRLGMDLVDAFEAMMEQMGKDRARRRASSSAAIWRNPVAWREARISAWGRGGLPLLVGWGIVLFAIAQTGVWLLPGGLLILGLTNAAAALLLTAWLAAGSVEQERHGGTLDMLLMTRMTSHHVVLGKLRALAVPTLPLLAVTVPMLLIGYPYAEMVFSSQDSSFELFVTSMARSVLASAWLFAYWLLSALAAMWVAFRVRHPPSAYGAASGLVFACALVPAFLAWSLHDFGWWSTPFRLLAPALARQPHPVELVVGTVGCLVLAAVSYVLVTRAVRAGGGSR